jgi:hypothetical protein
LAAFALWPILGKRISLGPVDYETRTLAVPKNQQLALRKLETTSMNGAVKIDGAVKIEGWCKDEDEDHPLMMINS